MTSPTPTVTQSPTPRGASNAIWWLLVLFGIVVVTVTFFFISSASSTKKEKEATAEKAKAAQTAATYRYAPPIVQAPAVRQFADCVTPCSIEIAEIRDLYTDGEPVFMLPPGWSKAKAIRYSGKGHLVIEGGNIHPGNWQFWSVDPSKVVLVRVFGKQ